MTGGSTTGDGPLETDPQMPSMSREWACRCRTLPLTAEQGDTLSYELMMVDDDGMSHLVGCYPDYETAVRARVEDVLCWLARNGGWWTRVEHVIVGPGVDGSATSHPFCTELGVDPRDGRQPTTSDLEDARSWLLVVHELDLPETALS
jgi:hypothetical protein